MLNWLIKPDLFTYDVPCESVPEPRNWRGPRPMGKVGGSGHTVRSPLFRVYHHHHRPANKDSQEPRYRVDQRRTTFVTPNSVVRRVVRTFVVTAAAVADPHGFSTADQTSFPNVPVHRQLVDMVQLVSDAVSTRSNAYFFIIVRHYYDYTFIQNYNNNYYCCCENGFFFSFSAYVLRTLTQGRVSRSRVAAVT